MFPLLDKQDLAGGVHRYVVEAPDIARKARPGQFVILRLNETGERIPITIADADPEQGALTLFVQVVGQTTLAMSRLQTGDAILDVAGPLGTPSRIEKNGVVAALGGGFGIAALYPIIKEHLRVGNRTFALLGAKNRDLLILENAMAQAGAQVRIATEDGSQGRKGLVTHLLQDLLDRGEPIRLAIAIGPLPMMRAVAELTRPLGIETRVSMNPIMMDGTGMCGACRVMVGGEMKFACVDGPEFDAHQVDFESVAQRLKAYRPEEKLALDRFRNRTASGDCRLTRSLETVAGEPES